MNKGFLSLISYLAVAFISAAITYFAMHDTGATQEKTLYAYKGQPFWQPDSCVYLIRPVNQGQAYILRQINISQLATSATQVMQDSCTEVDYPISPKSNVYITFVPNIGFQISSDQPSTERMAHYREVTLDANGKGIWTGYGTAQNQSADATGAPDYVVPVSHIGWLRNDPSQGGATNVGIIGHLDQVPLNDEDSTPTRIKIPIKIPRASENPLTAVKK